MDLNLLKTALEKPEHFLFEFEGLSQEKKDDYNEGYYQAFKKPNEEFDDYGLRYDVDFLNKVGTNVLISPVEYIANFVDIVTKNVMDKNEDILQMGLNIETDLTKEDLANLNATACGNIAYVYLHTKDEKIKEYVKRNLTNLFVWKVEEVLQYVETLKN